MSGRVRTRSAFSTSRYFPFPLRLVNAVSCHNPLESSKENENEIQVPKLQFIRSQDFIHQDFVWNQCFYYEISQSLIPRSTEGLLFFTFIFH